MSKATFQGAVGNMTNHARSAAARRRREFACAQMLFVPDFVMTQNFKMKMNKETAFITRISGLGWLAFLKCLGGMDEDDAFNTSFIVSAICAVIGPINAELNLDCNTAHGAAWVLFPVLLASHALAM